MVAIHVSIGVLQITHISRYFQNRNTFARIDLNLISTTRAVENKPHYYNRFAKQPKPKMSNSLEFLSGSISGVQKKYEILSDIVSTVAGKCHGSQYHVNGNLISLIVYFEIPEGKREEVKQKYSNYTRNLIALQKN